MEYEKYFNDGTPSNLHNLYPRSCKERVAYKNCSANLNISNSACVPVPLFSSLQFHSVTRCACVPARKTLKYRNAPGMRRWLTHETFRENMRRSRRSCVFMLYPCFPDVYHLGRSAKSVWHPLSASPTRTLACCRTFGTTDVHPSNMCLFEMGHE